MTDLEKQNDLLKGLLKLVVELLPKHSADCGVHRAHFSYGDKHCDCHLNELRNKIREGLKIHDNIKM